MKKETEIKIIEEIGVLLKKLLNANDSYIKTFIKPHVNVDDITIITNNILSDFPPLLNTRLEMSMTKMLDIYKARHTHVSRALKTEKYSLEIAHNNESVLEMELDLSKSVYKMLMIDFVLYSSKLIEDTEYIYRLNNIFDIEDIINIKFDNEINLNKVERTYVKDLIKNPLFKSKTTTDENTESRH